MALFIEFLVFFIFMVLPIRCHAKSRKESELTGFMRTNSTWGYQLRTRLTGAAWTTQGLPDVFTAP